MQTHNVKRNTQQKKHVQLGRGGRHGKTSGRGGKGLTARAGFKRRPALREAIKKLPKLRGYRFASPNMENAPVSLAALNAHFAAGDTVTPAILAKKGLVKKVGGRMPIVKILGTGALLKKLTVTGCFASASAKEAIEKAGGTIEA